MSGFGAVTAVNQLLDKASSLKSELDEGMFDNRMWEDMTVKIVETAQKKSEDIFRVADEITVIRKKRLEDTLNKAQDEIRALNNERLEMDKRVKEASNLVLSQGVMPPSMTGGV